MLSTTTIREDHSLCEEKIACGKCFSFSIIYIPENERCFSRHHVNYSLDSSDHQWSTRQLMRALQTAGCTNLSVQHLWWTAISSTRPSHWTITRGRCLLHALYIVALYYSGLDGQERGGSPIKRICSSLNYIRSNGAFVSITRTGQPAKRHSHSELGHSHLSEKRNYNITILVRRKEALSGSRILQAGMKREQGIVIVAADHLTITTTSSLSTAASVVRQWMRHGLWMAYTLNESKRSRQSVRHRVL